MSKTIHKHYHRSSGISIGSLIAIFISWSINKSIGWAIIHAMFGWLYVFYYLLGGAGTMS